MKLLNLLMFSYRDTVTPSLSPASMSVESPRSSMQDSPSPATFTFGTRSPSTADLSEFLQVSSVRHIFLL